MDSFWRFLSYSELLLIGLARAPVDHGGGSSVTGIVASSELTLTGPPDGLVCEAVFTSRKRGVETRLCLAEPAARPDPVLIKSVVHAHAWWSALRSGTSMKAIAEKEGLPQRRVAHLLKLAFLAPDITEAILHGRQPVALTTEALIRKPIPLAWNEQRAALKITQV